MNTKDIKLEDLILGENQARPDRPGTEIEELAQSIKSRGLLQPIRVVPAGPPHEGKYEIIMGQRRYLAYKFLNLPTIMAVVANVKADTIEYLIDSVTENTSRKNMSYEENKAVCVKLWRRFGSVKIIVDQTGLTDYFVRKHIKFATLPPILLKLVDAGTVSIDAASKAVEVAKYDDKENTDEELTKIATDLQGMTNSGRTEVKKLKKANSEVPTEEIIKKVTTASKIPVIPIALTAGAYSILQTYAKANDKSEADAASDIVEEAMNQQEIENDKS